MDRFQVIKTNNGFILDVQSGNEFGQYCFETEAKLKKAIKALLNDEVEQTTTTGE